MEKVPLWRTARLGMVTYQPDGLGRDKYIKYNNGGFWDTGEKFEVKKEYERPKYSNFHSLYHQAAPFKYYSNGKTRDSYILFNTGLSKDIKPLGSYKLTDFLRGNEKKINKGNFVRSPYEKSISLQRKHIENGIIDRLYKKPLLKKEQAYQKKIEEEGEEIKEDFPLRTYSCNFGIYNNTYGKQQNILTESALSNAIRNSLHLERYELKDEKSLLHKMEKEDVNKFLMKDREFSYNNKLKFNKGKRRIKIEELKEGNNA
jgi:hypothetical protein